MLHFLVGGRAVRWTGNWPSCLCFECGTWRIATPGPPVNEAPAGRAYPSRAEFRREQGALRRGVLPRDISLLILLHVVLLTICGGCGSEYGEKGAKGW